MTAKFVVGIKDNKMSSKMEKAYRFIIKITISTDCPKTENPPHDSKNKHQSSLQAE